MLLLFVAWHVGGLTLPAYFVLAVGLLFFKVKHRLPYLTFHWPALPKGQVRRVLLESDEEPVEPSNLSFMTLIVMSLWLLPYEATIIKCAHMDIIDTQQCYSAEADRRNWKAKAGAREGEGPLQEDETTGCSTPPESDTHRKKKWVLRSQEMVHSAVHGLYNRKIYAQCDTQFPLLACYFRAVETGFRVFFDFLMSHFPNVLSAFQALNENNFYYAYGGVQAVFDYFSSPKCPLINKIFCWHILEEIEHHQESVALYRMKYTGLLGVLLLIPGTVVFSCMLEVIAMAAYIATLLYALNRPEKIGLFGRVSVMLVNFQTTLTNMMDSEVCAFWSLVLMATGLGSRDEAVRRDLAAYRQMFLERYRLDLCPPPREDGRPHSFSL
uniref:Uncharacterized protein n=1 Tax=Chromera velia CCMP2878 TaxID=1169474 RepID=A0A0G4I288_9ALVE|eukprot:Cvel_10336.t1-p1 / transcript=Cvel_10336.t1 / gene=Cvel_10336 / organism=Chromera_velia_CCMP2878 / gene_product=hypothetical protein / transcript_product=hypothetical protein / location=Cvel_scaffold621:3493-4635(-) / protein_length=381 / sequence_SO=supercontig / SO=protein_coding / is_pseudo=false